MADFLLFLPQLKRKSARVASLEKQLQEKSSAYSQAALTNTELQNQLQVQNASYVLFPHISFVPFFPPYPTARHTELRVWSLTMRWPPFYTF